MTPFALDAFVSTRESRRYLLRRGTGLRSDAAGPGLGETDTGDPQVLIDFATWAIANYPAEHYLLVVWNHGAGWDDTDVYKRVAAVDRTVARTDPLVSAVRARAGRALFGGTIDSIIRTSAIGFDDHARHFLDNQELKRAFGGISAKIGRPLDIVGLDACLMSMVEVLYEIRHGADYVVASEETIPLQGWPYRRVLGAIADQPTIAPAALASRIVDDFVASYGATRRVNLAATDMSRIAPLRKVIDGSDGSCSPVAATTRNAP